MTWWQQIRMEVLRRRLVRAIRYQLRYMSRAQEQLIFSETLNKHLTPLKWGVAVEKALIYQRLAIVYEEVVMKLGLQYMEMKEAYARHSDGT